MVTFGVPPRFGSLNRFSKRKVSPLRTYSQRCSRWPPGSTRRLTGSGIPRYRSAAAVGAPELLLNHEHVVTRRSIVDQLLADPERCAEPQQSAVDCFVLHEEHRKLTALVERPGARPEGLGEVRRGRNRGDRPADRKKARSRHPRRPAMTGTAWSRWPFHDGECRPREPDHGGEAAMPVAIPSSTQSLFWIASQTGRSGCPERRRSAAAAASARRVPGTRGRHRPGGLHRHGWRRGRRCDPQESSGSVAGVPQRQGPDIRAR